MFADDGSLMELLDVVCSLMESLHVDVGNYMEILARSSMELLKAQKFVDSEDDNHMVGGDNSWKDKDV